MCLDLQFPIKSENWFSTNEKLFEIILSKKFGELNHLSNQNTKIKRGAASSGERTQQKDSKMDKFI